LVMLHAKLEQFGSRGHGGMADGKSVLEHWFERSGKRAGCNRIQAMNYGTLRFDLRVFADTIRPWL
jgi:hypothetical protein